MSSSELDEISIPILSPRFPNHPSHESLLAHRAPNPSSKHKSRLGVHQSVEATLKILTAHEDKFEPENLLSDDLSVPLIKGEQKAAPNEYEIYEKVTAQLKARESRQKVVKSLFNLFIFGAILGLLICSFTIDYFTNNEFLGLDYWKWFVLLMVIFSGLLITSWVVSVVVFFIEWKYLMKKNVVYFTHGLKDNVKVLIWFGLILGTWELLFKPELLEPESSTTEPSEKTLVQFVLQLITWTLVALVLGSFLWLVKTAIMKLIASSFHYNRYFDRINESIFQNYVLQVLSGPPLMERGDHKDNIDLGHGRDKDAKVDYAKLHMMKSEKVPFSTMQMLTNVLTSSGMNTMSDMLNKDVVEGGVELDDDEITSEEEATAMAYKIFCNIVGKGNHHRKYIDENDLLKFIIPEELTIVYPLFDVDESGHISLQEFCEAVVKIHKDRTALQHAMNDNKTAVTQLDNIVRTFLVVLMIAFWLMSAEIVSKQILYLMSSQLLVAVFIFGNTCKNIFEAIIFVFITHPFDVGDRIVVDGTVMVVEEMNLLTTILLKFGEKVYYPNNLLASKPISNYYRSPNQGDSLEFTIDYKTPLASIGLLKERINEYIEKKEKWWQPDHSLAVKEIKDLNELKLSLTVTHTTNFQNTKQVKNSKTELILQMKTIFDELDIKYHLLPQEVHLRNT